MALCGDYSFIFNKIDLSLLYQLIEDLQKTNIPEQELAKKYGISLDGVSKINMGKRCRLPNIDYPIRKRGLYTKGKKPCPICGKLMDHHAEKCIECAQKARKKISDDELYLLFDTIYKEGFTSAARKAGISDNAIKKRLKSLNIPHLIKDFRD